MRHRPRLDLTQKEIVEALRAAGYSVRSLAGVGNGCPDILVGCSRGNVLLEAKSAKKIHKQKHALSEQEQAFFDSWKGPVCLVDTAEGALRVMRAYQDGAPIGAVVGAC